MPSHSLSVTIDIEDWYHIPSVTGSPFSRYRDVEEFFKEWKDQKYDYLTAPTHHVLDMLNEYGIKATFFVVADVVKYYPGLVERIAREGHEIACHGLDHACAIDPKSKSPIIDRQTFERRTVEAKRILEKVSGKKIRGYRAPNAYVAGWMIDILENIGFEYDSSICANSFYNKSDCDLTDAVASAYYPKVHGLTPGERRNIIEFPWPNFTLGPVRFPTPGGPMLRFLGDRYIKLGIDQCLKRDHTVLYFHPIDLSDEKFPSDHSARRPFYWSIKGSVVEKRVRRLLDTYKDNTILLCERKDLIDRAYKARPRIACEVHA
jgi:peptidoglycan/xylan/chitin deacetylase (PgdA/CDA1 family)